MYAIKTEGLTKKYKGLTAVNKLDLCISQGELFALLGVKGRKNNCDKNAHLPHKA